MTHLSAFLLSIALLLAPVVSSQAAPSAATSLRAGTLDGPKRTAAMAAFEQHVLKTYAACGLTPTGLPVLVFREALIGYYAMQERGLVGAQKQTITIIDFNRPSTKKRLWVVDLAQQKLLFNTLVAHGKGTGEDYATAFSNVSGSEQSSIGFYLTGATYMGKHGLSLKLHGKDPKYNSNAASRAVVIHGAEYVCQEFINKHGRLGRSQGCPALPPDQTSAIVKTIKGGTVVYAHAPRGVAYASAWLQLDLALAAFARTTGIVMG
ncbi:murein L,D-transpeptidase catalytic domain family protein [Hymenobacter sp. BT175]|uniref:murein L,D-transpeptidase catalytic domain family protein n=1 Tax=Hymenobacter translucens TaxID=2886507 RepID=UPI001D0F06CE|nr:murein L,D-transpeptidase catalytic domain family protein [Hymenobacter translucens]MCC2544932.1 murein L,D-transpeptidase catalytic domain family protein [Hymenobacter translucens]